MNVQVFVFYTATATTAPINHDNFKAFGTAALQESVRIIVSSARPTT